MWLISVEDSKLLIRTEPQTSPQLKRVSSIDLINKWISIIPKLDHFILPRVPSWNSKVVAALIFMLTEICKLYEMVNQLRCTWSSCQCTRMETHMSNPYHCSLAFRCLHITFLTLKWASYTCLPLTVIMHKIAQKSCNSSYFLRSLNSIVDYYS